MNVVAKYNNLFTVVSDTYARRTVILRGQAFLLAQLFYESNEVADPGNKKAKRFADSFDYSTVSSKLHNVTLPFEDEALLQNAFCFSSLVALFGSSLGAKRTRSLVFENVAGMHRRRFLRTLMYLKSIGYIKKDI